MSCGNTKIGATMGAIVILALCACSCSSDTETEVAGELESPDTVTVEKSLAELEDFEIDQYEELKLRYPLGWAYLVVDPVKKEVVSRGRTDLSNDFEIGWSKAQVHDVTAERIIIQLPDICYKSAENCTGDQIVNLPRGIGTSPRTGFSPEGLDMWVQVLVDDQSRTVMLMGFREQQVADE